MVVTIRVFPDLDDPGMFLVSPERVSVDNVVFTSSDEAGEVLMGLFIAYDEGLDDISHLLDI